MTGKPFPPAITRSRIRVLVVIAQNEESSAVFGMPGEAVHLGAAGHVLPADKIAALLTSLVISKTKNQSD